MFTSSIPSWLWGILPCWKSISGWLQPPSSLQPVDSRSPAPTGNTQKGYELKQNLRVQILKGRGSRLRTCKGVNATLELVPEERSLTVDFPPYVMLCFCSVLCFVTKQYGRLQGWKKPVSSCWGEKKKKSDRRVYLEGFGDSGLGGLVDLSLPDAAAAALTQLTKTEAQILLIGVVFDLQGQENISITASGLEKVWTHWRKKKKKHKIPNFSKYDKKQASAVTIGSYVTILQGTWALGPRAGSALLL